MALHIDLLLFFFLFDILWVWIPYVVACVGLQNIIKDPSFSSLIQTRDSTAKPYDPRGMRSNLSFNPGNGQLSASNSGFVSVSITFCSLLLFYVMKHRHILFNFSPSCCKNPTIKRRNKRPVSINSNKTKPNGRKNKRVSLTIASDSRAPDSSNKQSFFGQRVIA